MKGKRADSRQPVIAYIFVVFPKITETFNLREMLQVRKYGARIEVFSLLTPKAGQVVHPEARELAVGTHYCPWFFSLRLWWANLYFLFSRPARYLGTLFRLILGSARQPALLAKTLPVFAKSAHFSLLALRLGVDHIHATFASHNTTCAMIMSALTDIEYSFTTDAYDLYVETALHPAKLARASFLTTISRYNLGVIEERYGKEVSSHTYHIPRGIDMERYSPAPAAEGGSGDAQFDLVCVASLQVKKGHLYLLEAIARLRQEGRDIRCVLVGDGPLRETLRRRIDELRLAPYVTMAGALTQDEVVERLRRADCCILPSIIASGNRMEGIPNALMEAMACELPVVSTRISGIPELVEEGKSGFLVPPEDSGALAEAIGRLQDNRELAAKLGKAGREKVGRDYNLDINIKKLMILYRRTIGIEGED